jgi:hypothetical protein
LGSHLNQYFSPPKDNGYYFNVPMQNFVNEFEKTAADIVDPRLDYTLGRAGQKWVNGEDFDPAWSPTGYLQKKHMQPLKEEPIVGDASLNYVYLRYADLLLTKAEALNELGRPAEALIPLNAVRKRARESYLYDADLPGFGVVPADLLPDISSTNQQTVRDAIRHERRVELGFEFHRFFDLMRYGQQVADAALVTQGKWWHIVVTFGGGHMVFYLDGVMVKDWDNTPGTAISQSAAPVNLVFGQDLPSTGYSTK